jgi:carbonic anhydrase/acetyltransferase-like protein (isoleucine patch superfamily)
MKDSTQATDKKKSRFCWFVSQVREVGSMKTPQTRLRRSVRITCTVERLDDRQLLSAGSMVSSLLLDPVGYQAVRPNTPVMPFSTPSKKATFIDPTVHVENGNSVILGYQSFVAPYVTLDGRGGAIKIANGSDVLDNSSIAANPGHQHGRPVILIGDQVVIGFGATIQGPTTIGAVDAAAKPTSIGANAEIDGATIEPGAIVSPLARVGPGVTVPSAYRVLPGANVTTDAQASNPKLGMVVLVTSTDTSTVKQTLSENESLTVGYSQLYQGNSATGVSTGFVPAVTGVNNGNLSTVLGAGQEPGPPTASFEPSASAPHFLRPRGGLIGAVLNTFPARLTGNVEINMTARQTASHLGRANAFRADQGQPITIGSIAKTGSHVTINSPLGGTLAIGTSFRAGSGAVILGGPNVNARLGNSVTIGAGAVVDRTSLGSGSTVGKRAYLLNSSFPAGTVIPPRAIYINNKFGGYVQW